MKNHSTFQRIASLLTVIEIAKPLVWTFETSQSLTEIYEIVSEEGGYNDMLVITQDGAPQGFLEYPSDFSSEDILLTAGQAMTPIEVWRVVAAQTSIFDLIPMWPRSYYYFVLDGTKITHVVSRHHMDSEVVHAALFSLTAELEQKILQVLLKDTDKVSERFQLLPAQAQNKARKLSEKKGLPDLDYAHVQNTYFSEKVTMLINSSDLLAMLPFEDVTEAQNFFNRIGFLRNELAHGGSLFNVIRDASDLHDIVVQTEAVLKCFPSFQRYLS